MSITQNSTELEQVIDAIADADVIDDAEKRSLLARIETEQGIVSDQLRTDIVSAFRRQASAEQDRIREHKAVLSKGSTATAPTPEEQAEIEAVYLQTEADQRAMVKSAQGTADQMRDDVIRMERDASHSAESVRRQGDAQSIEQIRKTLSQGGSQAA